MDVNVLDSNVDANTIVQQATQTIGSQQNIDFVKSLFDSFIAFVFKMFSDAFSLVQTNPIVYGIALVVFIYLLKSFALDRFDSAGRVPDFLKWFASFLIIMGLSPFWSPLIAELVK